LFEQLAIEIEAHRGDVPALLRAEEIARAANFQVAHRDFEPAAEARRLLDGADALPRIRQQAGMTGQKQIRISLMLVAPHAPAKLVKVTQSEPVCTIDD